VPFSQEAIRISQTVTHYSLVPSLTVPDSFLAGLGKHKKKTVLPGLQALNELLREGRGQQLTLAGGGRAKRFAVLETRKDSLSGQDLFSLDDQE
jgi:hypothetical protein